MKSITTTQSLRDFLIEANLVSGPQTSSINNSSLATIKRCLLGEPPFLGGNRYFDFGSEFHLRNLEQKKGNWKPYEPSEIFIMDGMVKALSNLEFFTKMRYQAEIELCNRTPAAFGIAPMHGTLDLKKKRKGTKKKTMIDLKTTSEETEEAFIKKAIKLGYPRQGEVYEELDDEIDETIFIGCSKKNIGTVTKPIFPIFIMDLNNFPDERKKATQEAE